MSSQDQPVSESDDFYVSRARLAQEQDPKSDAALADYNTAIKLNPNNATAYNGRGNIHYAQGKKNLALSDFNKAIALSPNDPKPLTNRGNVYARQNRFDLALADYKDALSL